MLDIITGDYFGYYDTIEEETKVSEDQNGISCNF